MITLCHVMYVLVPCNVLQCKVKVLAAALLSCGLYYMCVYTCIGVITLL